MLKTLKKLWGSETGSALIIAAAAFPMIVGSAGLATDTIQWTLWKRQLQRAADSAAIAGVYTRVKNDEQRRSKPRSRATSRLTSIRELTSSTTL